jgi:hypothetical protein
LPYFGRTVSAWCEIVVIAGCWFSMLLFTLEIGLKIKVAAKMPPLSTLQWSKVVSMIKELYTGFQGICTFFAKLYDRQILPSLLL